MEIVKTTLISLICIGYATVDSTVITSFPVVGIFTDENLLSSRNAFEVIKKRADSYHGEALHPKTRDSYSISMEVCQHSIEVKGISAVIDARSTNGICDNVCMLCNKVGVPHLTLGWQPIEDKANYPFTFSYYPDSELLSKAYATLIRDVLKWDKFAFLYEDEGSFIRLQQVIHLWPFGQEPILFRKLIPKGDNRETFKYIFKVAKYSNHIIDCKVENIVGYMNEVVQIENSTQYSSFIFTSLEAYTLDFGQMPDNLRANLSTFSIMPQEEKITWNDYGVDASDGEKMETALAADALIHIEKAIRSIPLNYSEDVEGGLPPNICRQPDNEYEIWEIGKQFQQTLLTTSAKGFTGDIQFDAEGKRTNLKLYYFKRTISGQFTFSGYWESYKDNITMDDSVPKPVIPTSTTGVQIIKVGSKNQLPYLERKTDESGTVDRGYAVDLINAIFENIHKEQGIELKAEFVVYEGIGDRIEGTKRWSHMMGALIDHQIEMAICDLGITSDRLSVVDFSTPFMTTGIGMLFKEREPEEPNKFSFLEPLSLEVWLYMGTTYIVVSFILFICARMSQDDWVNPHPCNQNPEHLENIWSLYNCTWLTMGAIMTQGCDILPRGFGSRWIAGMWWFFSLIVTSSYTANMSAFLSSNRRNNDIRDVKMLADQNKVTYGAARNSSTYKFFQNSNDTLYQKLWTNMISTRPSVFTKNNDEGKDRVLRSRGNYAFFMESTAIRYYAERECQLRMVGHQLDAKEYGIAMPKNFQYKGLVDVAILHLQEAGDLTTLENTWWVENDNEQHCKEKREQLSNQGGDDGSLQMENTSGIFLVLGAGTILGLIVAIIDFMMHAHEICVKEKVTFKEAFASEWRASLNPRALHKPAAPPRSAQPSPSPTPLRERSQSRAVSVLRAASSFINFDEIY